MASGTPHPSPQIGPQGPFLSSRTSTRPQKIEDLIESLLVFQKLIQQIFMWGKNLRGSHPNPIRIQDLSLYLRFHRGLQKAEFRGRDKCRFLASQLW